MCVWYVCGVYTCVWYVFVGVCMCVCGVCMCVHVWMITYVYHVLELSCHVSDINLNHL